MNRPFALHLLRFLPKNLISRLFGGFAARRRPRWMVRLVNRWWARHFEVDLAEAEHPIEHYDSLLAFFTRRLKNGARPLAQESDVIVSPVDGRVGAFGKIEDGRLLQAKGLDYSLASLLGSEEAAVAFKNGHFCTLYLSPRDYHRIHSPGRGRVTRSLYEPGTLWPVNASAVRTVPSLFAVNERVTTWVDNERGALAVVMVGATNVGSIRLAYQDFLTNRGGRRTVLEHQPPIEVERGEHLGTFELGSTVVVLMSAASFRWEGLREGEWVPLGRAIGRFGSSKPG